MAIFCSSCMCLLCLLAGAAGGVCPVLSPCKPGSAWLCLFTSPAAMASSWVSPSARTLSPYCIANETQYFSELLHTGPAKLSEGAHPASYSTKLRLPPLPPRRRKHASNTGLLSKPFHWSTDKSITLLVVSASWAKRLYNLI